MSSPHNAKPPSAALPAAAPGPWQRLHRALMPDYTPVAACFWWLMLAAGTLALGWSLWQLRGHSLWNWAVLGGTVVLAMAAGMFPVRVPGTRTSFIASELFLFLLLLMQGPAAAAVAAAAEAFVGTLRSSKRWTSRIGSPAASALAMGCSGFVVQTLWPAGAGWAQFVPIVLVMWLGAALYFFVGVTLVSGPLRLKRGEPWLQPVATISVFRWVLLAYLGSATVAALLFLAWREAGSAALWVMLPLLLMLLVTLHFYFRQQESSEQLLATAQQHLQELQSSERRFHAAFTHASIGMLLMRFDGQVLQANGAMGALLARRSEELLGQPFHDVVHAEDRAAFAALISGAGEADPQARPQELRCHAADGTLVWAALHCAVFTEPDSTTPCLILQAQDVTARRRAEEGLAHLAFHDPLTGLPNRRRFVECLAGAVRRQRGAGDPGHGPRHPYAVLFLDFDRFKIVNDSLGHGAGDALLVQMARRIQASLRPHDIVARLGGDEFAVLAEGIDDERDAVVLAERLTETMRQPFFIAGSEIVTSASIGITFSTMGYTEPEEVLRDADIAMYQAKANGKACYAIFDGALHTAVARRLRLEGELRHAIQRGQLLVEYQPLFALQGSELTGFEALVRWAHPEDGTLAPASFLPLAEESGLMTQVSDFVLHCACQQLAQWQRLSPALAGLTMSVNVSASDLAERGFVARVARALAEAGLAPRQLTLELTESILMSHLDAARHTLTALRALGVQLSVDDFGSGYSSLAHLSRLPIDALKIDRAFVARLPDHHDDVAVVRAIVQLGQTLRKTVVAEGIESPDQAEQLRALGCEFGQGFHLGTPLSAAAALGLLQGQRGALH